MNQRFTAPLCRGADLAREYLPMVVLHTRTRTLTWAVETQPIMKKPAWRQAVWFAAPLPTGLPVRSPFARPKALPTPQDTVR